MPYLTFIVNNSKSMKMKLLVTVGILFLTGCISIPPTLSNTEALSVAIPATELKSSRKLVGGGVDALVEQFELIPDSYRRITVSGNPSSESAKVM